MANVELGTALCRTVEKALHGKQRLFEELHASGTTAYRVFRGTVDGEPGWIADRFGDFVWIQFREGECRLDWNQAIKAAESCHEFFRQKFNIEATFLKRYVADRSKLASLQKDGIDFEKVFGQERAQWTARENGFLFLALPNETFSPGLFLDQRNNRLWVKELARDRRVLNLFAYTGGFSLAAALGGAKEVVSVDISKKWLEVAKQNFEINAMADRVHRTYATGALSFLKTAVKKREQFDLLIVDPPIFSRSDRDGVFSLRQAKQDLWQLSQAVVSPQGILFFSCNWQELPIHQLEQEILSTLPRGQWQRVSLPRVPEDFENADNPIAAVAFQRVRLN